MLNKDKIKKLLDAKTVAEVIDLGYDEITVVDDTFDCSECYFYQPSNTTDMKRWDDAMYKIASQLRITDVIDVDSPTLEVAFYSLIEEKLEKLEKADLFIVCEPEEIMDDMNSILSGNVSDTWLENFAKALEEK